MIGYYEQQWNRNKTFTGWSDDANLTDQGTQGMEHAARLLMEQGCAIDIVFTSRHKRAIRSTWILRHDLNQIQVGVSMNDTRYGSLTGLSKTQTAERLGVELVQE
jgi:2,3-bisphosphoglycerate-dependent phosphoglycerate mutase